MKKLTSANFCANLLGGRGGGIVKDQKVTYKEKEHCEV